MGGVPEPPVERWVSVDGPDGTRWVADAGFLGSRWRCLWGDGCQGIHDHPTPERMEGCCSEGVELVDDEDAARVAAYAACIPSGLWQHAGSPIFRAEAHAATARVDGACVFFNRPGFAGGVGCALHLAAVAAGESPIEWKPRVCWQLPLFATDEIDPVDGRAIVRLRRWRGDDWGDTRPAWWCTAAPEAYTGDVAVHESLRDELVELCGESVADALTRAAQPDLADRPDPFSVDSVSPMGLDARRIEDPCDRSGV